MAVVKVKGGRVRDLDAKAFAFCTAEGQQDSLHLPACMRRRTLQSSKPRRASSSRLQCLSEGKAARLAAGITGGTLRQWDSEAANSRHCGNKP